MDHQTSECHHEAHQAVSMGCVENSVERHKKVGDYFGLLYLELSCGVHEITAMGALLLLHCERSKYVLYTHQQS